MAHLPLPAERCGPPSQKNKKIDSQSSFRYKYEQTKYVLYGHTSKFILASATQRRLRDKLQWDFCSCVTFSTRLSIFGYVMERAHLRSSAKSSRFRFFIFTCRRVENPDSHKYVLWKRSNFLIAFQHLDNYHTWASERRAGEDFGSTWTLKISAKKVVFLVSSRKKQISPLLAPPWKNFLAIQ